MYNKQGENLTLESAAAAGGRIIATNAGYKPQYFVTDHLGSVRVVVNDEGAVVEKSNFYPYGKHWVGEQQPSNRYLFNGKEAQAFVDVPYLDYGARMYDGKRWFNIDPLAEKYYSISPYAFCLNNPLKFVDPNGKDVNISLLNQQQQLALLIFLKTDIGKAFLGRYMKKGDAIKIGKQSFTFSETGDRAKDDLWLRSSELGPNVNGQNNTYTKKGGTLESINYEVNIVDGVYQTIDLNKDADIDKTVMALGHEAFVHADRDANKLNEIDQKIKANKYNAENESEYRRDANAIHTSGQSDHRAFGNGQVPKYETYVKRLVQATGNQNYMIRFNKEKQQYK